MTTVLDTDSIAARSLRLPQRAADNPGLLRRGRYLSAVVQLGIGDQTVLLRIVDGSVVSAGPGPTAGPSCDFAIAAPDAIWRRLCASNPPPGDHDLFAFWKRKELNITGNLQPFMSHLLYFKELLSLLREPAE
jgi:hypothetical protein